jgi:hypothetical protein
MTDDAAWGDDDEEYEDGPEDTRTAGLGVTALAGGIGAAAGYYAGGPGGAALGTAATPFLAAFFQKAVKALWADRARREEAMMETAAETSGLSSEEFAERAAESEQTRFLTQKAIEAAGDTIWPAGVRAIGRALAAGLLAKNKPAMDVRQRVLGVMKDLDELHVSLLELLVKYEPDVRRAGLVAVPHSIPSYVNTFLGGDRPDNPKFWLAGRRTWTTKEICVVKPHLEPVLSSVLGELRESGLAQENDTAPDAVKQLGDDLAGQVNRQAGHMNNGKNMKPITLQPATIGLPEPTWSPTELGEKVLAFYVEAGVGDSQE